MSKTGKERRIKARVTNEYVQYVHNDLSDAAYFLRHRLESSLANKDDPGPVYVESMSLLMLVAFTLEGYATFVGDRIIRRGNDNEVETLAWENFERRNVKDKIKLILRISNSEVDWNKRPFCTVERLVRLRNLLAHPKAIHPPKRSYEAVGTESELKQALRDYRPDHAKDITPEFAIKAYLDVNSIWKKLLQVAEIGEYETWDGGPQGIEYLGPTDD